MLRWAFRQQKAPTLSGRGFRVSGEEGRYAEAYRQDQDCQGGKDVGEHHRTFLSYRRGESHTRTSSVQSLRTMRAWT